MEKLSDNKFQEIEIDYCINIDIIKKIRQLSSSEDEFYDRLEFEIKGVEYD